MMSYFSLASKTMLLSVLWLALSPSHSAAHDRKLLRPRADSMLFSAVVRAVAHEVETPIRVDPRPLKPDPHIRIFPHPEDLADVSEDRVQARAAALAELGIEPFRMFENDRCGSGPGGTPPAITPQDTAALREWRSQPRLPTCVLVSLPWRSAEDCPVQQADGATAGGRSGSMTVRVVTIGPGSAVDVYDVVACKAAGAEWRIGRMVRIDWVRS